MRGACARLVRDSESVPVCVPCASRWGTSLWSVHDRAARAAGLRTLCERSSCAADRGSAVTQVFCVQHTGRVRMPRVGLAGSLRAFFMRPWKACVGRGEQEQELWL